MSAKPITRDPEHKNAVAAMHAVKYRISGDVVNKATRDLPDDQRSEIRWLHNYGASNNLSLEDLGDLLKKQGGGTYSKDSVYQLLTGRRTDSGASIAPMCEAISRVRKIIESRASIRKAEFIETSLTKRVWKFCDAALMFQRIAFIYGHSQIGKTTALEEYARTHNHGQTVYVRMPTRGQMGEFTKRLAIAMRISPGLKEWQIKQRILDAFDDRMLLIVDQCHECFRSYYSDRALSSLLFAMEIHDLRKCGLVMAGTTDFELGMHDDRHKDTMIQLLKRGFPKPLRLGDKPTRKNLEEFARFYGLDPAAGDTLDFQSDTIRDYDLGVWLSYLTIASRLAAKQSKVMTWEHVHQAKATFDALGGEIK